MTARTMAAIEDRVLISRAGMSAERVLVGRRSWRAARACGIATSGWMPEGLQTEDGPRPEFLQLDGAAEARLV
jgi:hypothetical protein